MIYLTLDELLHVATRAIQGRIEVRDHGLLQSALARPRTTVLGEDAYGRLEDKAAALVHSLVRNHALVAVVSGSRGPVSWWWRRLGLAGPSGGGCTPLP